MKWNRNLVVFLGCAFLVQVALPSTAKQFDEAIPSIAIGEHHWKQTRCSEPISLFVGDNATLYCNASVTLVCDTGGAVALKISWFLNGKKIGKDFENRGWLILNNSLVLRNVSVQSGLYTCVVSNANGTANATTIINFIDAQKPKIFSEFKTEVFTANYKILPVTVGSNVTAYGKSLLMLVCNVSSTPKPRIEWSKENGKIERKYIKGDELLLPHNVALSGKYFCTARNFAGEIQLASDIQFIEPVLPMIVSSKKKLSVIQGENQVSLKVGGDITTIAGTEVIIRCRASGVPAPTVTWYHNGKLCPDIILSSYGFTTSVHNKAIEPNASGNYTCVATNPFGSVSVTSSVKVIEPVMPYINGSSEDVVSYDMSFPIAKKIGGSMKTLVGASFWLECNVGGIPRPKVTWKKDNLPIHSNKRIKVSEKKIEILGSMMSDTGWYSCIAANGAGTVAKSTFVQLLAPEKPRITTSPRKQRYIVNNMPMPLHIRVGVNLRILAYRELFIYCSATGFPTPVLSWEKNGEPFEKDEDIYVGQGGRKLVFKKLVPSQNGRYTCVASNAAGQDRKRTIVLSRLPYRPKIELRKSVLSKKQPSPRRGNIRVYEIAEKQTQLVAGSDVVLECIAKRGYPGAKFKWFKDGKRLRKQTIESFNRSKLKLLGVQNADQGVYKCYASNLLGQQEKVIELKLTDPNGQNKSQVRQLQTRKYRNRYN